MPAAGCFLDHNCHAVPEGVDRCAAYKGPRIFIVCRGIDQLDCGGKMGKPEIRVGMVVRDHISFVQAGAGTGHGIFQKTGGANGQRGTRTGKIGFQMPEHLPGQRGVNEGLDQIRQRAAGKSCQPVVTDKILKNVCTEDQGVRDVDGHFRIGRSKVGTAVKGLGQKGHAPGLTTDGSVSDSGKPGRACLHRIRVFGKGVSSPNRGVRCQAAEKLMEVGAQMFGIFIQKRRRDAFRPCFVCTFGTHEHDGKFRHFPANG